MEQKIKIALCVRVAALLIGPGLYCLLSNTPIDNNVDDRSSIKDGFAARHLMNVKDHEARDFVVAETDVAVKTRAIAEDRMRLSRSADFNFATVVQRGVNLKNGRIVLHVLASCYCFLMLAIICDEYFIGSIQVLCQKLHMQQDVAAATFMAIATSSPEFVINCIGTFVTEGDIGVSTIAGSAVFNCVAVPALCGLFTHSAIQLEWWSVSRDCFFYGFSVIALIAVIYDGRIMWYEAAFLVSCYTIYLFFMYKNKTLCARAKLLAREVSRRFSRPLYREVTEITPLFIRDNFAKSDDNGENTEPELNEPFVKLDESEDDCATSPWHMAPDASKIMYFVKWPITFTLWCTIPDASRYKSCYILTFVNCVLWIGCISYFVVNISTNVDSTFGIVFLAAGTSLPEAISSVVVTLQGFGSMGISNSLGSNTFNILLCLGFPWLVKTLIAPTISGQPWITLKSTDIAYTSISLLTTLAAVFLCFVANNFKLDRKLGCGCLLFYILFVIFAFFTETRIFYLVSPTRA